MNNLSCPWLTGLEGIENNTTFPILIHYLWANGNFPFKVLLSIHMLSLMKKRRISYQQAWELIEHVLNSREGFSLLSNYRVMLVLKWYHGQHRLQTLPSLSFHRSMWVMNQKITFLFIKHEIEVNRSL